MTPSTNIPFLDLKAVNNSFEPALRLAIQRVLDSGWYLLGNELQHFETEYAAFIGTKHCIGMSNGLDALRIILRAAIELGRLQPGDEVLVPANTYIASLLAITENNLKAVPVEPDPVTHNINAANLEAAIGPRTKALMIVHLYGQNAYNAAIQEVVDRHALFLVEDNAQAVGAFERTENHRTGSLGHAAGHSFYPGKNMGALGDAGAVTTNDDELAAVVRSIANYGSKRKYVNQYKGLNCRLDELQAAVLRVKLQRIDADNAHRRVLASSYNALITHPNVVLPKHPDQALEHVWHLYVIRHPRRDQLQTFLANHGVHTLIHYPIPPHKQEAYPELTHLSLPLTEQLSQEVLSLPMSQVMSLKDIAAVAELINQFER
jgi:dTDP-4-amino-4,6-dideoxygalactose transaminase